MSLEAVVLVLDNSEYARNGDLAPSRWESQLEAVNLVSDVVLQTNAENGIGLILASGKQVRLLMTPTNDQNVIVGQCDQTKLYGQFHFSISLQQAYLALKHRINKKQQMRIVAFVASPIEEDEKELESLAKKLKKNNITVDIINFGEQNEQHLNKLNVFFKNVQKGNNSQFINLEPGSSAIETLFSSLASRNQAQQENQQQEPQNPGQQQHGGQAQFEEYGGIDPNLDPELAEAMKLSLMDAQKVQEEAAAQQDQQPQQQQQQQGIEEELLEENDDDEEALLKKAKELSEQIEQPEQKSQQVQQQIQQQQQPKEQEEKNLFKDPEFLKDILGEDEDIQGLLKKSKEDNDDKQ